MAEKELVKLSLPDSLAGPRSEPDAPPGFPPKISTAAAADDSSRDQIATSRGGGFRRGRGRRPYCSRQYSPRRTSRKRSRPQFYAPPPAPQPEVPPRRRGRPPKARLISQLSYQELETSNTNPLSLTPLTPPQYQISSIIKSLHITNEQEPIPLAKNQPNNIHTHDIHETLIDISLKGIPTQASNDQICETIIDPKILQHVANALHYMDGAQAERSSEINKDLADTLKAINRKHGDITEDCSLESGYMRTLVLIGICKVVQDLQKKQLKDVDISTLDSCYTAVRDAESMKVNVGWLHDRLDEIRDVVRFSVEAKGLVNEKNRRIECIDSKKKELLLCKVEVERVKSEIRNIEQELAQEAIVVKELNERISARMLKSLQFEHMHLMDGLI